MWTPIDHRPVMGDVTMTTTASDEEIVRQTSYLRSWHRLDVRSRPNMAVVALTEAAETIDRLTATVARLEAENERLRSGLDRIVDGNLTDSLFDGLKAAALARAALARNGEKGNG